MKDRTLIFILVVLAIVLSYINGFKNGVLVERNKNRELVRDTFNPIMDCLSPVHYSLNEEDLGTYWSISDLGLPINRNCKKEVGTVIYSFITNLEKNEIQN